MSDKYVLVEHSSAINTIIRDTFQTTQRIKPTAFDVSRKYLIFGVNSGGIYIFTRESCQFLKLIPSTHGPANLLSVSSNETNLAIAVSTGLVIVLENFHSDFEQQVFAEHEGVTVTAMKWHGNDLYCGDSTGRVSVTTLKNFLTKAMFQVPVACLLHLDSQIVQLDAHSKFLLVSTQTRTVLCDTEMERYRQMGKKLRDGNFGACFLNTRNPSEVAHTLSRARGAFQTVGDNEQLSPSGSHTDVKIYCARPGVRLWEGDFEANVVVTHQFRPSLTQKHSDIIKLGDCDALTMESFESESVGETFSFGKIFSFVNKLILAFRDEGFYIFEPSSSALLHWSTHLSNIKDIKLVDSYLYIWHSDLEVSVLSLLTVEELVLRSLLRRRYRLCGELCVEFFDEVQALMDRSKKIHLVSILESKLDVPEVLAKLAPIFQSLKECVKIPSLEKLRNGIVTVNALPALPESVENFESEKEARKEPQNILLEQYKINKIQKAVETTDFVQLVNSLGPNEFYESLAKFKESSSEDSCYSWSKEIYLKHLMEVPLDFHPKALEFACQAFFEINSKNLVCQCEFPLPQTHSVVPKYYEIGSKLMEKSKDYGIFLKNVPYMHKFLLEKIDDLKELQLKIPLIIQFSDPTILEVHSKKVTYDVWDESARLLFKLKSGQCLNCGANIDTEGAFEWTNFAILMVQSIKPTNTIKLLKRYANQLPKGELDYFFYQYCVFAAVSQINSHVLSKSLQQDGAKKQLEASVGGYLRRKYLRGGDYYDPPSQSIDLSSNCDHCQLPLKIPIIEEITKLTCGHNYHRVCFLYNGGQCPVCESLF